LHQIAGLQTIAGFVIIIRELMDPAAAGVWSQTLVEQEVGGLVNSGHSAEVA